MTFSRIGRSIFAAALVLSAIGGPALAQSRSEAERQDAYRKGVAADQAAIQQSYREQQQAYDRAIGVVKGADSAMRYAVKRVPYGPAAYAGSKLVGETTYNVVKKKARR